MNMCQQKEFFNKRIFFNILIKDPMYALQHLLFASTLAFFDTLYILIYMHMHTIVFYAHFFNPNEFSNDWAILEVGALAIDLKFSCHRCCLSWLCLPSSLSFICVTPIMLSSTHCPCFHLVLSLIIINVANHYKEFA